MFNSIKSNAAFQAIQSSLSQGRQWLRNPENADMLGLGIEIGAGVLAVGIAGAAAFGGREDKVKVPRHLRSKDIDHMMANGMSRAQAEVWVNKNVVYT